jgi:alkanesulfonate monooxygenase SsuD/methylene tetrahydromethanopterin reductase-like flavin-dependent oxidoreductase (luciferase family)
MKYGLSIRYEPLDPYEKYRNLPYPEIRDLALSAEEYGFDSVHVPDHIIGFDPERKEPYLEAMVLMSAIAAETRKVKIGHIVLANSYRNPALTAKMISTLDNISNGRALFWIGAGWYEEEYKAYGYPFPTPKQRVDELEESLTIFKKLFTEEVTNFKGKFWKLENCKNFPKPIQKPWPQIVVGGQKNRLITIACRETDGFNLVLGDEDSPRFVESLKERIEFINSKLQRYNRNSEEFEISIFNSIALFSSEEELDRTVDQMIQSYKKQSIKLNKEQVLKNFFIGYAEDVKEKVRQAEELGVKKIVISEIRGDSSIEDPVRLFRDKIM